MRLGLGLYQTQQLQQRIIMTPKLQQAIQVLLMPRLELAQFMTQQLQQNPLLEETLEEEIDLEELGSLDDLDPDAEWNEREEILDREDKEPDIDWENCFDDMMRPSEKVVSEQPDNVDGPQSDVSQSQSLQEFLLAQLAVSPFSELERKIGEQIIGNLNGDGQLKMPLFSISPKFQNNLDSEELTESLWKEIDKKLRLELKFTHESRRLLFSIDSEIENDLDRKIIPQVLHPEFRKIAISLSENVTVSIKEKEKEWTISSENNKQIFLIRKEHGKFNIFLQSNESILSPDATLTVEEVDSVWRLHDEDNAQTYTIKKEKGKLNFYNLTFEDLANAVGCDVEEVEDILYYIQRNFEPAGIAFRTIPEALLIQMKEAQIDNPIVKEILENHFDDYKNNQIPRIAQNLKVSIDQVIEAGKLIGTLDLYPGRYFSDPNAKYLRSNNSARYIIPEVTIEKVEGEYAVTANDDGMPRLRLNPFYVNMMRNGRGRLDGETKQWLERRKSLAVDLLSSINERRKTITKVTEAVFEIQKDFLEQGIKGLKPLTLRIIAEMADVHESTVSRVTTNKYVDTPQGTYPLKFFFSSDLSTDSGLNISATVVKEKIKEMVQNENLAKPLSDQGISNTLEAQGITAARRTVAKYREEIGILSSNKRKRKW